MSVDLLAVKNYLAGVIDISAWSDDEITEALNAESAAQAKACTIPEGGSADLDEALKRRVSHNLAVRKLPLGVQPTVTDFGPSSIKVGGLDSEVYRFELPYRKKVCG